MRKEYRSDHSTEKHSPTRTQADGHTDFSWVVPKSVQVRGDRTYANSDVNHKINKTIGSVCGYRSESSRKICPFRFRLMHQIGRMIQSFFLRSYFDHSTAHLNSSGTFMTHSRDLHVVFASTQPTATPLFRTCADSKTECTFYAVTCTFIHDKVGQCPVCGGRSSLQKDDLRALLKPSRVNRHNTMDFYHIRKTNHASQFTLLRASSRNGR